MKIGKKMVVMLFMLGLPLHTFLMMFLFGRVGVPANIIAALTIWKEAIIIALVAIICIRVVLIQNYQSMRLTRTDCLMAFFSAWIFFRLAWSQLSGNGLPLSIIAYGLRFYFVPVILYLIGRLSPLNSIRLQQLLKGLTIVGAVTGGVAVFEWLLPNSIFINLLEFLGYQNYFRDYVNQLTLYGEGYTSSSMWMALTQDFFVRRAGSIYMVSKPFAFTYLLIIPITLTFLWSHTISGPKRWVRTCLALSCIGLTLSLTRAVFAVCLICGVGMALHFHKSKLALGVVLALVISGLCAMAVPAVQSYVSRILQAEDSSTRQHLDGWINGFATSPERFMIGYGVGTANQELDRFDLADYDAFAGSVSESIYVQTFQELGIIGLVLYIGILLSLLGRSKNLIRRRQDNTSTFLGTCLWWTTSACILIGLTAILSQGAFLLTYFYWFLCGQANTKAPTNTITQARVIPNYAYRN